MNFGGHYEKYLLTAAGKITCLRCTAKSTRTKMQCRKPALRASRTQKCEFHGGRSHSADVLRRISEANMLHGKATKVAKQGNRYASILMHELEDALYFLGMADGPRMRGRKPLGYGGVHSEADVIRMIRHRLLHHM